jgi:hypothetical protein
MGISCALVTSGLWDKQSLRHDSFSVGLEAGSTTSAILRGVYNLIPLLYHCYWHSYCHFHCHFDCHCHRTKRSESSKLQSHLIHFWSFSLSKKLYPFLFPFLFQSQKLINKNIAFSPLTTLMYSSQKKSLKKIDHNPFHHSWLRNKFFQDSSSSLLSFHKINRISHFCYINSVRIFSDNIQLRKISKSNFPKKNATNYFDLPPSNHFHVHREHSNIAAE